MTERQIPVVEIKVAVQDARTMVASRMAVTSIPSGVYVALFPTADGTERSGTTMIDSVERCFLRIVSPRYQHCQFVFIWIDAKGTETYSTFSTTMERPSEYTWSSYKRRGWIAYRIKANPNARGKIFGWCEAHQNTPFNTCGYYWNFLPCVPGCCAYDSGGSSYFCAEQVAEALRSSGISEFSDICPHRCTPDDIANRLSLMKTRDNATLTNLNVMFQSQSKYDAAASTAGMRIITDESTSSGAWVPVSEQVKIYSPSYPNPLNRTGK